MTKNGKYYAARPEIQARTQGMVLIHVGAESAKKLGESSFLLRRVAGKVEEHGPNCHVETRSSDTVEALHNCTDRDIEIAVLSINLPESENLSLLQLIDTLLERSIRIVIVYKLSEREGLKKTREELLMTPRENVTTMRIKEIDAKFPDVVKALTR